MIIDLPKPDCHIVRLAAIEFEIEDVELELQETAGDPWIGDRDWADVARSLSYLIGWRLAILEEISE